jgi:peptide chain release factor subunit 1
MRVEDHFKDSAALVDHGRGPDERAQALATRLIAALERPEPIVPSDVAMCNELLGSGGASSEEYAGALGLLAAVIYWRPDFVGPDIVTGMESLFANPQLPEATHRHAGDVLNFLLATPAAPHACDLLLRMLAQPGRSRAEYQVLLDSLEFASLWAMRRLDLASLVTLAEHDHLADHRERLLHVVIERAIFARPGSMTVGLLKRLVRLFEGHPSLKYLLFYLIETARVSIDVRTNARALIAGQFPLHEKIRGELGEATQRALIVQNIADAQGDEIIRVVPLLESLLRFNPLLEVVLVTKREYLYAHPRIVPVSIDDRTMVRSVLRQRFDVVIDFFEPNVPQVNYNRELEHQIKAHVRTHRPFLSITALKGWNDFVYQRVDVESRAYADVLKLERQRVDNIYETTFRLIAELGLPLRLGEEPPETNSVLAGLPCRDADAAWSALVAQNADSRPVALLCPFGGIEPLKGYVERRIDSLVERVRGLIGEGFYVVLLPNGMPWGSSRHAREVVSRLEPSQQGHVVVAPDPAETRGSVTYEHAGTHTVPGASYQMRLVTYFVRFADLVVTVEGWMVHAAYSLGKRYRVLMLPYSHPSRWHPYGRTLHQDVAEPDSTLAPVPSAHEAGAPPLPEQPRKFVLLFLLGSLGRTGNVQAVPLLRWALQSEDRDVRLAATESIARISGPDIDSVLRALLADPANRVRGVAATALLERMALSPASLGGLRREDLLAHEAIGREGRDWASVLGLGAGIRTAIETAMNDDDLVVRREAAEIMALLDRHAARSIPPSRDRTLLRMLAASRGGSTKMATFLRGLHRRARPSETSFDERPTVLILTPVKDAADCLDGYAKRLHRLTYPHGLISLGFLESDSSDTTFADLQRRMSGLDAEFRRARLWKKDFGYRIPPGVPRWEPGIQVERRAILAKSRNHLLFHALDDEAWVLWLDVDVVEYPPDLIERLLAADRDVVQPHCVLEPGGRTFDLNGWRDHGRLHLHDLRGDGDLVELDAVGGTVLLVRADVHREGLIFPSFLYGAANPRVRTGRRRDFDGPLTGEIETEGLGIMAHDMGYRCWGMPDFEVIHRRK